MSRWLLISWMTVAALVPASSIAQSLTRGPYLQSSTPTSITVRWRTSSGAPSYVRYGSSPGSLTQTASDGSDKTEHIIQVTGLSPNTRHYYSVGTQSTTLAGGDSNHYFETHPNVGTQTPMRIWAIGDFGTGNSSQRDVRDRYYELTGSTHTDVWLMLGDNAYSDGTDSDYQTRLFDVYPALLRNAVAWSTFGNHDAVSANSSSQSGPYYDIFTFPKNGEAGGVASGTEAYYSFDYGTVHFVCLDSAEGDRSANGPMAQWLQADLAAANAEWIIAFWHHPPYSKGTHDSDTESYMYNMRQNMVPILEAGGVDIVLTGHSHNYERSFFLDGHYGWSWEFDSSMIVQGGDGRVGGNGAYTKPPGSAANEGAVYAVVGASGQAPSSAPLNHPAMIFSSLLHGSMVIDIDGDRLDARYLTKTGTIYDWFTIEKPGTSEPTAPVLGQIPDQTAIQGVPYTGPAPQLQQGSQPVDFTLDQAPSGMTIDEGSGVVTWPDPE